MHFLSSIKVSVVFMSKIKHAINKDDYWLSMPLLKVYLSPKGENLLI